MNFTLPLEQMSMEEKRAMENLRDNFCQSAHASESPA